ncbi:MULTISPECIES: 16S rRNA (guanine(527)-N(7))-methyltransferase RsmG [unclassified Thermosynechococcus]|uniref:16S rRNA (guanine(527)-N(7))-methyltransferase RsmG n=1 Tax=unclassified Thermosynechococcus TaxID=2622553 RepID=UPI002106E651|nr:MULTISPECIES: 16S rRNA (guanine(527)-N(7))-methyltransferase RsmG [unclassified Thermosynechococcus]MDR7922014.1 16S rRNA (guanine(527)-N(7))-methyltransferase RsmG [Thermosynechococcus sp. HY213]WNC32154.1 16S rRNA (guanine(527)-N(7))-methyltransferase RsmG [Thermosynechococcus sp. PKX95]WNC34682.1 16S rRNA (guanine(527)-N(7))-methyltransferase RsmG [Thermosynechococcus sp. PKX91]WNC37199.1 16S rRNA (guanine(527)-N(7))-methyltransferase RsmG [Thermosynechococcus sp. WL11]WNC39721.1 16S rRN
MASPSPLLLEPFPWQETLQWQPTPQQQEQFQRFYGAILAANQGINLTRITAVPDFWEKHLWDSLRGILPWLQPTGGTPWGTKIQQVIDIGSGGGFPGVPVAIARPDWSVTLLEATQKKVKFLQSLPQTVDLANIHPEWGRAETHGRRYDLALMRAVGNLRRCCAYGLPLLRLGGILVLYRGQWSKEDAQTLGTLLPRYRSQLLEIQAFTTPLSHAQRHCVYLQRQG